VSICNFLAYTWNDAIADQLTTVHLNHRLSRLLRGATFGGEIPSNRSDTKSEWLDLQPKGINFPDNIFDEPSKFPEQLVIDAIIEATIYEVDDRNSLRNDPLARLLIHNPPGYYNFVIVSAAGVITEGMY
jgi:hypothetical protein